MKNRWHHIFLSSMVVLSLGATPGARAGDFDPESTAWDGIAATVGALSAHLTVHHPPRITLTDLTPNDVLFFLDPDPAVSVHDVAQHLIGGGALVLAGDGASSDHLFEAFGIELSVDFQGPVHLRGHQELVVAFPTAKGHALSDGAQALVTNRPAAVSHDRVGATFEMRGAAPGGGTRGLVLAGQVGDGQLVAVGDPSLFINQMLTFRGNRDFVDRLGRYLRDMGYTRVVLAHPSSVVVGSGVGDGPLEANVDRWGGLLREPVAVHLLLALLVILFVTVSVSSLPRRSPYNGPNILSQTHTPRGHGKKPWGRGMRGGA